MQNLKATYIKRVVELFAKGRYSEPTERRVGRWLTDGKESKAKDEALQGLWSDALEETSDDDAEEAEMAYMRWRDIADRASVQQSVAAPPRYINPLRIWQGVAAVLAVGLLSLGWLLTRPVKQMEPARMMQAYCPPGETRVLTLPDGTEAVLNGATTLTYPERFDGSRRDILLMGEANFKVVKDATKPFTVTANDVDVTALGTEFNVKAYPVRDMVEATLLEGSVRVEYGKDADSGAGQTVLSPGEQLVFNRNTRQAEVKDAVISDITAWQRGEIVFNNVSLAEIIAELENRFTNKFVYNVASLPPDRYTFRFRKGMTLQEVMKVVSDVTGNVSCRVDSTTCKIQSAP